MKREDIYNMRILNRGTETVHGGDFLLYKFGLEKVVRNLEAGILVDITDICMNKEERNVYNIKNREKQIKQAKAYNSYMQKKKESNFN